MATELRGEGSRRTTAEVRARARNRLIESRLTPNAISMTGLVGNLIAAALVTQQEFFLAGVAFVVGSVMDTLDGRYSRMSGKGTLFGAFLDSTLDRFSEAVLLGGVLYLHQDDPRYPLLVLAVVTGSLLVSYTRARAEGLNPRVDCEVGFAPRPQRVILLAVGLMTGFIFEALVVLAVLTNVTTLQRILHVRKALAGR